LAIELKYSSKDNNNEINIDDVCYLLSNIVERIITDKNIKCNRDHNGLICSSNDYIKTENTLTDFNKITEGNNCMLAKSCKPGRKISE